LIAVAVLACHRTETPTLAGKKTTPAKPAVTQTQGTTSQAAPETPSASTNVGDPMPAYSAKKLDGSNYDLGGEKGSVVLVNVWATWCGPCRFEIPELQKLHDEFAKRGFKVVGVSVDQDDTKVVKDFVAEQKMTYPVVLDPDQRIASLLQTTVLPTTVLLDRKGKIVWRMVGAIPGGDPTLKKALSAALAGS